MQVVLLLADVSTGESILVLLLAIFAVVNMVPTTINFRFTHVRWPLIIVIAITPILEALMYGS